MRQWENKIKPIVLTSSVSISSNVQQQYVPRNIQADIKQKMAASHNKMYPEP